MKILGLSGVPLLLSGGLAFAQETGGLELTFDLSQRFEYNEESGFASSDDEGFRSITGLGFGLTTATRGRSLTFGVVTNIAQNLSESASTSCCKR